MKLSDFRVLSFDCYGTLIDWEAGLRAALDPLVERSGTKLDDEALLEAFGQFEHEVELQHPTLRYAQLLEKVHDALAEFLDIPADAEESRRFGASVGDWPAFPDSAEALAYLKQHFQLIILSNVDRKSFAGSTRRLGVEFDGVYTAEEIGSYKPDPRNFEYLLARVAEEGIGKDQLLHVAQSLFHDHVPANSFGIASAWVDRRDGGGGGGATLVPDPSPHYDFRFGSLAQLAEAHRAEIEAASVLS